MEAFRACILMSIFSTIRIHVLTYDECSPSKDTCEYWFVVEERLTMHWGNKRVYAKDGVLYRHNEGPDNHATKIPVNEVITMDGFERAVLAVNNSIPGPPIIVYEGQKIVVHVTNHLLSEAITMHWHGMHQKGTSYSDGVAFISQCPIDSGQKFTYVFNATPHGTFFYHSHIGGQRIDGLFGAIIVKTKEEAPNQPEDLIMHVGDWFHDKGSELHAKMIYGNFKTQPGFVHPETLDGVKFAPFTWKSGYIEGRGRYLDPNTGNWTEPPLKVYDVERNKKYRFRVIGSGMILPLRVSVDNHLLEMVSSDGYQFEPVVVESVVVNPGERFDFVVEANQTVGNHWIRVQSMESNSDHYVNAIFRYNGAPSIDPTSSRMNCTAENPCKVMNCPFLHFPKHAYSKCIQIDELSAVENTDSTPSYEADSEEHFMNFVAGEGRMVINGNIFEHPSVSSFSQPNDIAKGLKCQESCEEDKNCYCYYELTISYGKTIQMVWTNHGSKAIRHHPIHLHGHSFHVLKIGYGKFNESSGELLQENHDINCGLTQKNYCNHPKWNNVTWGGDQVHGLRIKNAPQKDTLMIPAGSYAVVRFKSDNPGKWFLHCHIEFHSMQGMAMVINEAPSKHTLPPKGFPVCQNFYHDSAKDLDYVKRDTIVGEKCEDDNKFYFYLMIALAVLIAIENLLFILVCCCGYRCRGDVKAREKEIGVEMTRNT